MLCGPAEPAQASVPAMLRRLTVISTAVIAGLPFEGESTRRRRLAGGGQGAAERLGEVEAFFGSEEAADGDALAVAGQHQPAFVLRRIVHEDAQPIGLEGPFAPGAINHVALRSEEHKSE